MVSENGELVNNVSGNGDSRGQEEDLVDMLDVVVTEDEFSSNMVIQELIHSSWINLLSILLKLTCFIRSLVNKSVFLAVIDL